MKLSELDPRWLVKDGVRVGFTFLCPCCNGKNRLTCYKESPPFREQVALMHAAMHTTPEDEDDWPIGWVPATTGTKWTLSSEDFNTMTVHPSIDASRSGNWHGWIKNGEIA